MQAQINGSPQLLSNPRINSEKPDKIELFEWPEVNDGMEVTNQNTDQGLLRETVDSAKEMLEVDTIEAVADKGYESREDILDCLMNGIVPNVALKYDREERVYALEYEQADISEQERNAIRPEDIQKCMPVYCRPATKEPPLSLYLPS